MVLHILQSFDFRAHFQFCLCRSPNMYLLPSRTDLLIGWMLCRWQTKCTFTSAGVKERYERNFFSLAIYFETCLNIDLGHCDKTMGKQRTAVWTYSCVVVIDRIYWLKKKKNVTKKSMIKSGMK